MAGHHGHLPLRADLELRLHLERGAEPAGAGASNVAVSATLGVDCNTLYHFRAVATNGAGTTNGANASFTTAACPAKSIVLERDSASPWRWCSLPRCAAPRHRHGALHRYPRAGSALAACSAVALSGSGDARSAACQTLLAVAGMHRITATYSGDGANAPGTSNTFEYPVGYLTRALNVDLTLNVDLNQHGLTGSWYEPATSGQGLAVEVFPNQSPGRGKAFVSWFTFDSATGGAERQRWYTLQGPMVSGASTAALTIYQNSGGNFNAPPATTAQAVGTATLSFDSCVSGQLTYNFSDGSGRSGTIPLTRLLPNVTCAVAAPYPPMPTSRCPGVGTAVRPPRARASRPSSPRMPTPSSCPGLPICPMAPARALRDNAGIRRKAAHAGLAHDYGEVYETTGGSFDTPTPPRQQTVAVGSGTMCFRAAPLRPSAITSPAAATTDSPEPSPCIASVRCRQAAHNEA